MPTRKKSKLPNAQAIEVTQATQALQTQEDDMDVPKHTRKRFSYAKKKIAADYMLFLRPEFKSELFSRFGEEWTTRRVHGKIV